MSAARHPSLQTRTSTLGPAEIDSHPAPAVAAAPVAIPTERWRLLHIQEINEGHFHADRRALANVYATLDPTIPVHLLYLVEGNEAGVALYFGVVAADPNCDVHEAEKTLRGALEGHLPGINFGQMGRGGQPISASAECKEQLSKAWQQSARTGVMLGVPALPQPTQGADAAPDFQGLDRLARGMMASGDAGRWRVAIISTRLSPEEVRKIHREALDLASQLANLSRTSLQAGSNQSKQRSMAVNTSVADGTNESISDTKGKNESASEEKNWGRGSSSGGSSSSTSENSGSSQSKTVGTSDSRTKSHGTSRTETRGETATSSDSEGSNYGITQEINNKPAQRWLEHLDKQLLPRLEKGLARGMFRTAVYFGADSASHYQRLKNLLRATFQGEEGTLTPLTTHDFGHGGVNPLAPPLLRSALAPAQQILHSYGSTGEGAFGSLVTVEELAVLAGLPQRELPGIRRRAAVDFVLDLPHTENDALVLGALIDQGRIARHNPVSIARRDLVRHVFVTGVTGAGKTTTCLNLLVEYAQPFLVIEPAKTEYRVLAHTFTELEIYRPISDPYHSLRINPLALVRQKQNIRSHVGFLKNVFAAVFPLEASMPMMLEAAMLAAYEEKGWDLDDSSYIGSGTHPFDPTARAWPTLSDMLRALDRLIPQYKLGREFEEKYRGSLVSRLRSLTEGTLGRVLDVPQSMDWQRLIESRAIIELEELQGNEEKALVMALLLGGINEALRERHARQPSFRHLTLVEEAHRLLSRPSPGDKAAALAVEAFADMLAEVRKYGEGLIIADQIPAKLIPDVIKNTHTKIVHRLFAEDDRQTMGEAMMMSDEQRDYLPKMAVGEAVIFCGGWHGPALAQIRHDHANTEAAAPLTEADLQQRYIRQYWQQRHRYAPELTALGLFDDQPNRAEPFVELMSSTLKAQNQFLHLHLYLSEHMSTPDEAARARWRHLREWQQRWAGVMAEWQPRYTEWRARQRNPECWPRQGLAAVWMSVMLDANPLVQAKVDNGASLYLGTDHPDRSIRAEVSDVLIREISECERLEDRERFRKNLPVQTARELKNHIDHLCNFKRI